MLEGKNGQFRTNLLGTEQIEMRTRANPLLDWNMAPWTKKSSLGFVLATEMHSTNVKGYSLRGRKQNRKNKITGSADKSNSITIPLLNVVFFFFFFLLIRGTWLITVQSFELEILF